MNYALGYTLTPKDLFYSFDLTKLKMTPEQCKAIYSDGNKRDLIAKIFAKSMEMVLMDVIDNNVHFQLPGSQESYIFMKRIEGELFKKAFKRGKWRDVDFIESNFSGYQLYLEMKSRNMPTKEKPIYVSPTIRQKIVDNTNSGKLY